MVGSRGQRIWTHRRLSSLAFPDGGDAEEVGVKAGPEIVAEIEDEAPGREVVLGEAFACFTRIQHAAEEGKILLHKISPRRGRGRCSRLVCGEREGSEEQEREERAELHGNTEQAWRVESVNHGVVRTLRVRFGFRKPHSESAGHAAMGLRLLFAIE